jgi:disulfide bond formation protein DsbB
MKVRWVVWFQLVVCICAIGIALFYQYFLGLRPCWLCQVERAIFLLAGMFCVLFLCKSTRLCLWGLILTFFVGCLISGYHVAINFGFVSYGCAINFVNLASAVNIVSCKSADFKLLGLSAVSVNLALNLTLLFTNGCLLLNYNSKKTVSLP